MTCFSGNQGVLLFTILLVDFLIHADDVCVQNHSRIRRDVINEHLNDHSFTQDNAKNIVAYFSGSEIIRFTNMDFNLGNFTIEFWLELEGGQYNHATIVVVYNHCSLFDVSAVTIGLKEHENEDDESLRIFFSLQTKYKKHKVVLTSHQTVPIQKWFHVAAVYDGVQMTLYIDQAKVDVSHEHSGYFLSNIFHKCTSLEVGGDSTSHSSFRGSIDNIKVWRAARSQQQISSDIVNAFQNKIYLILSEDFSGEPLNYYPVTGSYPELISIQAKNSLHQIEISVPNCGRTICDNPDIIQSYSANPDLLMPPKMLRYRIINLANDDGKNLLLSEAQIKARHKDINKVFGKYNITWLLSIHVIKNTQLRHKTVLVRCCDHQPSARQFIIENELKKIVNLPNDNYLNIFPVKLRDGMLGKATFPWVPNVFSIHGGTVINVDDIRHDDMSRHVNNIIHELGHNLGLWHVHKGVSDIVECDDECAEKQPSMIHGDLCNDTSPTPINMHCRDHVVNSECNRQLYKNTPYKNFMGYTPGECADYFTIQQQARMHCYIDQFYQTWQPNDAPPSAVPLPPRVLSSSSKHLLLHWIPPIGLGKKYSEFNCQKCQPHFRTLKQYASSAYSPQNFLSSSNYQPSEAVGPPDASVCNVDSYAWSPVYGCGAKACYLEVSFQIPVIPTAIKIWIIFKAKNAIKDLVLVHTDDTRTSLGPGSAHCRVPYTRRIKTTKYVNKVQIYVNDKPAIDAVQLVSESNHQYCMKCEAYMMEYKIFRSPPFLNSDFRRTAINQFRDSEIESAEEYEYRIQVFSGNQTSLLSPWLRFIPSIGYCGDGVLQKHVGEQCDDGNIRNGDGCDVACNIEPLFNCISQPSLCYRYDRDGVCEDFEKETSLHDCGFFTPKGFVDQWALKVTINPIYRSAECPESIIEGEPCSDLKCITSLKYVKSKNIWWPCNFFDHYETEQKYWIEAQYQNEVIAAAVVIYLASDGSSTMTSPRLFIELKDTRGVYHKATNKDVITDCKNNPMSLHIMHDMTQPVFKTVAVRINFNSSAAYVAITAIALRSAETEYYFKCRHNEVYDPKTRQCRNFPKTRQRCTSFHLENATFNCTGNKNGDYCKVQCIMGYLPRDTFSCYCKFGMWKIPSKCVPINCGLPNFKHVVTDCPSTVYGSVCNFSCKHPAKFHGKDTTITCQHDGSWKKADGHCYVTCDKPKHVQNSNVYDTDSYINECGLKNQSRFDMGTRCRYRCNPGYRPVRHVSGTVTGGNTVNILCNEDALWVSDGNCEKVTCPPLSAMGEYLYNCTDQNKFLSVCGTTCLGTKQKPHYTMCKENGEWTARFDVCETQGACKQLPSSQDVDTTSCTQTAIGSVCRPQCKRRRDGVIPDITLKGREDVNDVVLFCMPNKQWFPRYLKLLCIDPCISYELNDGMCDCHNNNKHCNYDGGDCCAKDLESKVYFLFQTSPRCPCIDPEAQQNLKNLQKKKKMKKTSKHEENESESEC